MSSNKNRGIELAVFKRVFLKAEKYLLKGLSSDNEGEWKVVQAVGTYRKPAFIQSKYQSMDIAQIVGRWIFL